MTSIDDLDTEDYLKGLLRRGEFGAAANSLTQLAAVRAAEMPVHAVNCRCPHCKRRRLDAEIRARRAFARGLAVAVDAVVLMFLLRRIVDLEDQVEAARLACEQEQADHLAYRRKHPARESR